MKRLFFGVHSSLLVWKDSFGIFFFWVVVGVAPLYRLGISNLLFVVVRSTIVVTFVFMVVWSSTELVLN